MTFDSEIFILILASGTEVTGYAKTEGAWILSLNKRQYTLNSVAECAAKCDVETTFTCKQVHTRCVVYPQQPNLTQASASQPDSVSFTGRSCMLRRTRSVGRPRRTPSQRRSCVGPVQLYMKNKARCFLLITLGLMFSLFCVISDVWTVSANTAEMKQHELHQTHDSLQGVVWSADQYLQQWAGQQTFHLRSSLILIRDQIVMLIVCSCFLFLCRIPHGVCKWTGVRLQRNKVQIKDRKDVSEMESKIPTCPEVCIHVFSMYSCVFYVFTCFLCIHVFYMYSRVLYVFTCFLCIHVFSMYSRVLYVFTCFIILHHVIMSFHIWRLFAVWHQRVTPEQTWTLTSAETLMETAGDPGVTPPTPTPGGSTATYPAALVRSTCWWYWYYQLMEPHLKSLDHEFYLHLTSVIRELFSEKSMKMLKWMCFCLQRHWSRPCSVTCVCLCVCVLQRSVFTAVVRTTEERSPPLKAASLANAGIPRNLRTTDTSPARTTSQTTPEFTNPPSAGQTHMRCSKVNTVVFHPFSSLPEKYLEENYCRNPDGDPKPWCFTTSSSKRWDFCSIPRCSKFLKNHKNK